MAKQIVKKKRKPAGFAAQILAVVEFQVTNFTNDSPPDSRNRAFRINPAITPPAGNFWNSGNKTIIANYIMSQTGRPDQFIDMTLTHNDPR